MGKSLTVHVRARRIEGVQSMQVLSKLECDFETIADYSSRNASSARLVDGSGEATRTWSSSTRAA